MDPVVVLMFVFTGLALVGMAIAFGMSQQPARPPVRRRVFKVVNLPAGTYRWVADSSQLPALPWGRIWHRTSKWTRGWWVVCLIGSMGPNTPRKFRDRWDPLRKKWITA